MRYPNIDLLKGILIVLVIIGHILLGSTEQSLSRYIIYCFHIPLFIGISGYLFNYEKMGSLSVMGFIKKFLFRILLPWAIAVIVYKFIISFNTIIKTGDIGIVFLAFRLPYNHLWFIAAYFTWVLFTWIAARLKTPLPVLLIIAAVFVFIIYYLKKNPIWDTTQPQSALYSGLLFTIYRPHLYIYFVAGMLLRSKNISLKPAIGLPITLVLFAAVLASYWLRFSYINWLLYAFNLSLLLLMAGVIQKSLLPRSKPLEWIGSNSMGVYLWHMVPLYYLSVYATSMNTWLYYVICIVASLIFGLFIYFLTKIRFINRYIFGMQ